MTELEDDDIVSFTDAPSEEESVSLTELGRDLYSTDEQIQTLEKKIEDLKKHRQELVMKKLPDYMSKIKQDRIGLEEFGVDLVLEDYVHANIASDWEPEKRDAAFAWLEESGNGDLLKTTLSLTFPRKAIAAARWAQAALETLVHYLQEAGAETHELPEQKIEMGVPWNTLTAFCKEQIKAGNPLPLEVLGCTVGKIVKIKERKGKK